MAENIQLEHLKLESIEGKRELREFALKVLDDQGGIKEDAYTYLRAFLQANGSGDIVKVVEVEADYRDGERRAFIGEDVAEDCLREIDKWAESMNVENAEEKE